MRRDQFRKTVVWLSFVLTILVILAHSLNAELFLGTAGAAGTVTERTEALVGGSVAQIAVPGFFMISSFLFFRDYDLSKTIKKCQRRVRTLLLPYLLWNGIYYLGYVLASRVPGLSRVVGKGIIPFTAQELLRALLLHTYNYGFWYILQLLLLTLLSPLIYVVAKRTAAWALASLLLCGMIALRLDPTPVNADALLYYLAAAGIALRAGSRDISEKGSRMGPGLVAAAVLLNFLANATGNDLPRVLCRMSGAAAVWTLCAGARLPEPRGIIRRTFLIYAIHFAPVRLITKAADVMFHGSAALALGLYFLMPVLILLIAQGADLLGKRYCPGFLRLLTGGR
ncbi:MAG: acyltransferase family protein [Stomatobaculum sp.]